VAAWTTLTRELEYRPPLLPDNLFGHLVATAVPGVEEWHDGAYRCTLRLPHGPAIAALRPGPPGAGRIRATLHLADSRDADSAVAVCRRILDLDADPTVIDRALARDPVLAPLVAAAPGRRVPGTADAEQFAVRAVLGQQVSTAAARTHAARLVAAHGEPVEDPAVRARELIEHHRRRLEETAWALDGRPRTGYDVSLSLFGDDLAPQQRRFAVAETLSHLERLVVEGGAERAGDGRVVSYTGT
jgi:hypothetical protein